MMQSNAIWKLLFLCAFIFSCGCGYGYARTLTSQYATDGQSPVTVLNLTGSMHEMGQKYGQSLKEELRYSLDILKEYFESRGGTYEDLVKGANKFQERYTQEWDEFLQGMASGSGLTHDDCKILNAMETLQVPSIKKSSPQALMDLHFGCTFAYIPGHHTSSGRPMIARNYDYGNPFDQIAKNLVLTVIHQEGKIPTAIIGMPGQIYCPSCLNALGYFLELNNGGFSGGGGIDPKGKPSMLIDMLDFVRTSTNYEKLTEKLNSAISDYSLIVNAASEIEGTSFEYSTRNSTVHTVKFGQDDNFVSTNFFQSPIWNLPPPTDQDSWMGVSRRNNLLKLLGDHQPLSFENLKHIMDVDLAHGGAKWAVTIYQIIYSYETRIISLKVPSVSDQWIDVDLKGLM